MSTFATKKLPRKYSMLLEQCVDVYIVSVIAKINARKKPVRLCKNALRLQSCVAIRISASSEHTRTLCGGEFLKQNQ